ncbi:unnamed protein product [Rangifer tarandus platyrhynchus]|uniref:Uncharacterized protein n=1 Tax=Rangifer tarandus platyrhynchus TaxID=3082113 RepID=A0ABN9A3Y1_RANTA|nr:unnamed protein product [Rangifer tarandus platyrhynchus]
MFSNSKQCRPGLQLTTSVREEGKAAVAAAAARRETDSAAIAQRSPRQSVRCAARRNLAPRRRKGWRELGAIASAGESTSSGPPCAPRIGLASLVPLSYSSIVTDHLQHLCTIRVFFLLWWPLTNYTILNGRRPSSEHHDDLDDSDDNVVQE